MPSVRPQGSICSTASLQSRPERRRPHRRRRRRLPVEVTVKNLAPSASTTFAMRRARAWELRRRYKVVRRADFFSSKVSPRVYLGRSSLPRRRSESLARESDGLHPKIVTMDLCLRCLRPVLEVHTCMYTYISSKFKDFRCSMVQVSVPCFLVVQPHMDSNCAEPTHILLPPMSGFLKLFCTS